MPTGPRRALARASRLVARGWASVRSGTSRDIARYVWYRVRGIDLAPLTDEQLGFAPGRGYGMANSGGVALERVLGTLHVGSHDGAIDLGCGKGSALISLAKFPFGRVAGIDLSPGMVRVARRNLERLGHARVQLACADARDFPVLDGFTVIYMFNPFPEPVLREVMRHVARSLERTPRVLTIVYKNPRHEDAILDSGLFERRASYRFGRFAPFVVYASVGRAAAVPPP